MTLYHTMQVSACITSSRNLASAPAAEFTKIMATKLIMMSK
jgi:hypothetical protein